MDKESKPNEEQDWKARFFESFDNIEKRLDNIEMNNERRTNNLEAKVQERMNGL